MLVALRGFLFFYVESTEILSKYEQNPNSRDSSKVMLDPQEEQRNAILILVYLTTYIIVSFLS